MQKIHPNFEACVRLLGDIDIFPAPSEGTQIAACALGAGGGA
jgi:hypothetical protein